MRVDSFAYNLWAGVWMRVGKAIDRMRGIMNSFTPADQRIIYMALRPPALTVAERSSRYRDGIRHAEVTADRHETVTENRHDAVTFDVVQLPAVASSEVSNGSKHHRPFRKDAEQLLDFLNSLAGRSYRKVDTTLKPIEARLNSGVTVQNCKGVIARKVREWKNDPKMSKFLRPETLFGETKFESYLGEREPDGVSNGS